MIYRCKSRHGTKVEFLGIGEFRLGETKRECVIYSRNMRFYVRTKSEFMAKFEPNPDAKT